MNACEILSGYVFAGKPIPSNFLTNTLYPTENQYRWGILEAGESFSITFEVQVYTEVDGRRIEPPKSILTASSNDLFGNQAISEVIIEII